MAQLHLYQFRFSHFSEKARWGLDFKGLRYQVHSMLAGFHAGKLQQISGQSQVPVLMDGSRVISGSAAILEHLEDEHPQPALYPNDDSGQGTALELQRWLDEEVGPALRQALFFKLFRDPAYAARLFSHGRGTLIGGGYRLLFPGILRAIKRKFRIDAESAARARRLLGEALDRVGRAGDGYLVGAGFSLADLTAASLLAPVASPPRFPYLMPQPVSPAVSQWLAEWKDHPGTAWVLRIYREHRGEFHGFERSFLGTES